MKDKEKVRQDKDQEYIGNIWGWKISYWSLGLLLFMLLAMGARYYYLKSTDQYPVRHNPAEIHQDSLK